MWDFGDMMIVLTNTGSIAVSFVHREVVHLQVHIGCRMEIFDKHPDKECMVLYRVQHL